MASTLETPNSQQYVDFDEYIDYQLQKTRGNIKSTDILTAFACIAAFVLAYLLLFVISDHWLVADGFSQTARVVLLSLVGLLSAGWFAWKVVWPYLRQVNGLFAAKVIEKSQPELRSTLLNLIDARTAGQNVSPQILSVMEKRAAISMSHANVDEAVDRRPLMRACYAVLALVVLFSLYTLFTPKKVSTSIWRALFPASAATAPTQTVIEKVSPGDVEVIPGTRLEVLADITGDVPEKVVLRYSTADREFVDEPIEMRELPDMPRRYRAEIIGANGEGIQQDLNYYITAGDDSSARYAVTVLQPPAAEIVELQYSYPAYMDREPKTRTTGNIDDYEGVKVTFIAQGNMPLGSATITFHDDQGTDFRAESLPMSVMNAKRTRFRANWKLNIPVDDGIYPRYYTIECKNERGDSDPNPTRWPIRIHPDQRPEVLFVNPRERELKRPANAILPLTAAARDDFKVKKLTLWKQRNDDPPIKHITLFEGEESSLTVDYDWRLNEGWELKTGDKLSYWVEAEDNRTPEPGRRNSDKYTIRIQPEQSEKAVQEQLDQDRRPQESKSKNSDPSQKNSDEFPKQNPERPQEQSGEQQKQNSQDQPMPQEGQPQQQGEKGGSEENTGEENSANKGEGEGNASETGGGGQSVKNDGSQDGKALERLHEHYNKTEPGSQNENNNQDNSQTGNEKNKSSNNTGEEKPSEPKTQEDNPDKNQEGKTENTGKPGEKNKQPGETENADHEEKPVGKPEVNEVNKDQNTETGNEPMPNGSEKTGESNNNSANKHPGEKPEKTESQPNDKPGGKDIKKPEDKKPEGQQAEGGSDNNTGQGEPSDSSKPSASKTGKSQGGEDTKPQGGAGRKAEKPIKGNETPAEPDQNAEKRKPTGEETGPGTAEDDPNADTKRAKNPIDRKDPEKPAVTKNREGDPNELTPEEKSAAKPGENPQSENTRPGSQNPNTAEKTKQKTDRNQNPDETPGQVPEADPNKHKPPKTDGQPNAGEDELKGRDRPEGQRAEQPAGGEEGSGKKNEQGKPGSNEKGPGDRTPRPGETEPADKPNGGKPSSETGKGSQTRPTEQTENAPPQKDNRPNPDAQGPNSQQPNEKGSQSRKPGPEGQPTGEQAPGTARAKPAPERSPVEIRPGSNPRQVPPKPPRKPIWNTAARRRTWPSNAWRINSAAARSMRNGSKRWVGTKPTPPGFWTA